MTINDAGPWCIVWITDKYQKLAHAFFATRGEANMFQALTGGELYLKQSDGKLVRQ